MTIPPIYGQPFGTPLYWGDETSGVLKAAVQAYFSGGPMTTEQFALVLSYLAYVIHAPCWRDSSGMLDRLRGRIATIETRTELRAWIDVCLEIGIDPL